MLIRRAGLAVIAFGTLLCACGNTKTVDVAECRLDTDRVYPRGSDIQIAEHMRNCMLARDYDWSPFVGKTADICGGGDMGTAALGAECYHRVPILNRMTDR